MVYLCTADLSWVGVVMVGRGRLSLMIKVLSNYGFDWYGDWWDW